MDRLTNMENISSNDHWTNESHSNFLSLMEASFVKTMFKKSCNSTDNDNYVQRKDNMNTKKKKNRLNRFVPDIAESTLDLHSRKSVTSGAIRVLDGTTTLGNTQRQRLRSHPYKLPHDQVVPQLEDRANDQSR